MCPDIIDRILNPHTVLAGRQYDGNGNVAEWWTPDTVANFEVEAQCYIDQYDAFCYEDIDECVSCLRFLSSEVVPVIDIINLFSGERGQHARGKRRRCRRCPRVFSGLRQDG